MEGGIRRRVLNIKEFVMNLIFFLVHKVREGGGKFRMLCVEVADVFVFLVLYIKRSFFSSFIVVDLVRIEVVVVVEVGIVVDVDIFFLLNIFSCIVISSQLFLFFSHLNKRRYFTWLLSLIIIIFLAFIFFLFSLFLYLFFYWLFIPHISVQFPLFFQFGSLLFFSFFRSLSLSLSLFIFIFIFIFLTTVPVPFLYLFFLRY